jgi:hypothetical protein
LIIEALPICLVELFLHHIVLIHFFYKCKVINIRGELFISKMIVFCEGETEEQAFPILLKSILVEQLMRWQLILWE